MKDSRFKDYLFGSGRRMVSGVVFTLALPLALSIMQAMPESAAGDQVVASEIVSISQGAPQKSEGSKSALDDMLKEVEAEEEPAEEIDDTSDENPDGAELASDKDDEPAKEVKTFIFNNWNDGAASLKALTDYVENVTDPDSQDFIPEEDRIVVSDFDGTLYGELCPTYFEWMLLTHRIVEDESFTPTPELKELAGDILKAAKAGTIPEDLEIRVKEGIGVAFRGMSVEEYMDYVREYAKSPVIGFENMTWNDAFFKPMVEVVDYLNENGFRFYIVTGSSRYAVRALIDGVLDIPPANVIGTDFFLKASGNNDTPSHEYSQKEGDESIFNGILVYDNLNYNKIISIKNDIGQQPVIALGNSSGDMDMASYVTTDNKYKALGFFVLADDEDRDYGSAEKAGDMLKKLEGKGWSTASEKDDWKIIY